MKTRILILLPFLFLSSLLSGQADLLVEGSLQIGDSGNPAPEPGTIRWSGLNFEGWNGFTWVPFASFPVTSTLLDIDGNTYRTVIIGTQEWMAENLRTTRYADGADIPRINNDSVVLETPAAWWWYDNDSIYEVPYRKLYNWYAVGTGKLCPIGWHVPTDAEWTTLIGYLDPADVNANAIGTQSTVAGGKMKEVGTSHWRSPNTDANNESGFTGLPGGIFDPEDTFSGLGSYAYWWSSSQTGSDAWYRQLGYWYGSVVRDHTVKTHGRSVRCIRN